MSEHEKLREAIKAVRSEVSSLEATNVGPWKSRSDALRLVCDAAESTLPKTELVETWHVEWVHQDSSTATRELRVSAFWTEAAAHQDAKRLKESPLNRGQWSCIRVTGPHQQEVTA